MENLILMAAQAVALPANYQIPDNQGSVRRGREAGTTVGANRAAADPTVMAEQAMTLSAGS
jgi:hypothetical protein